MIQKAIRDYTRQMLVSLLLAERDDSLALLGIRVRRLDELVDVVQLVKRERALVARKAETSQCGRHRRSRLASELTSMPFSAHKSTVS